MTLSTTTNSSTTVGGNERRINVVRISTARRTSHSNNIYETNIQLRKNRKQQLQQEKKKKIKNGEKYGSSIGNNNNRKKIVGALTATATTTPKTVDEKIWNMVHFFHQNLKMILSSDLNHSHSNSNSNNISISTNLLYDVVRATRQVRIILGAEQNAPYQKVIQSGLLVFLIELLVLTKVQQEEPEVVVVGNEEQVLQQQKQTVGTSIFDDDVYQLEAQDLYDPISSILYEVTWALTNIASSEYTSHLVQYPQVVDRLGILLLHYPIPEVRDQVGWCLGNIAGDTNYQYRTLLLQNEMIMNGFIKNIQQPASHSLLRTMCWSISNLCRKKNGNSNNNNNTTTTTITNHSSNNPNGKPSSTMTSAPPPPPLTLAAVRPFIRPLIEIIEKIIALYDKEYLPILKKKYEDHINNKNKDQVVTTNTTTPTTAVVQVPKLCDMISDAMLCLSYISDNESSWIQVILDSGNLIQCIQDILKMDKKIRKLSCTGSMDGSNNEDVQCYNITQQRTLLIPTIQCLGNILSGTNEQASMVIHSNTLRWVPRLLDYPSPLLRKEICWMFANVAAGTEDHISSMFDMQQRSDLLKTLVQLAGPSEGIAVRKEALWTLCNIVTNGTERQMYRMVQLGVIPPLCAVLALRDDVKLLLMAMDALSVILQYSKEHYLFCDEVVMEYHGVDYLEKLFDHPSEKIYQKYIFLLETYFNAHDVDYEELNEIEIEEENVNNNHAYEFFVDMNHCGGPTNSSNNSNITMPSFDFSPAVAVQVPTTMTSRQLFVSENQNHHPCDDHHQTTKMKTKTTNVITTTGITSTSTPHFQQQFFVGTDASNTTMLLNSNN